MKYIVSKFLNTDQYKIKETNDIFKIIYYDKFIEGRYSAFGVDSKIAILDYFGGQGKISSYVQSFLTPDEDLHKKYSEFLNVDFELIQEVHEICSAPDIIKETLYYSYPMKIDLHNFKNSLSLGK